MILEILLLKFYDYFMYIITAPCQIDFVFCTKYENIFCPNMLNMWVVLVIWKLKACTICVRLKTILGHLVRDEHEHIWTFCTNFYTIFQYLFIIFSSSASEIWTKHFRRFSKAKRRNIKAKYVNVVARVWNRHILTDTEIHYLFRTLLILF